MSEPKPPFLQRIILRNYKSIRNCDVALGPLALLVGPNGSGKSNFLDAIRFVADSLRTSMKESVTQRGGVGNLFWRGAEDSDHFDIQLQIALPSGGKASYDLTVGAFGQLHAIEKECCTVHMPGASETAFRVEKGKLKATTFSQPPPAPEHELYLTAISQTTAFYELYNLLSGMRFFHIDPRQIGEEALSGEPVPELLLSGKGALSVTHRVFQNDHVKTRIQKYLRAILPGLVDIRIQTTKLDIGRKHGTFMSHEPINDVLVGDPKSLKFIVGAAETQRVFGAQSISDGTLRAYGVLLALFQCLGQPADAPIPLVGIEEPEATLHPAAAGVLFDALHEASSFTQVLATTHSAELLNIKDLDPASLLVVDASEGETIIGPADDVSLSTIRDRLFMAGELLEMDQLKPNPRLPETFGTETVDTPPALSPDNR